ncbi:basigin-like [Styela clava]
MRANVIILFLATSVAHLCNAGTSVVILPEEISKTSPLSLTCGDVITLGENDTLTWMYTNSSNVNQTLTGHNLYINVTDNHATGEYVCYLNGKEKIAYTAAKLTEPEILNTRTSITYNEGDTNRKITCKSEGSYPDPEFTWTRRGELEGEVAILVTSETNPNYVITNNGTRSVLKFYNVTYEESSNFICFVQNVAGNGTVEVLVRVKDKYAAVWPFLGIVTEVVILIAVIFLYEKRSKNAESKEEVCVNLGEDEKLTTESGTEVRNRNGGK